jgi:hypothetical protein
VKSWRPNSNFQVLSLKVSALLKNAPLCKLYADLNHSYTAYKSIHQFYVEDLTHQYDIQASLMDYERVTGVVESRGSMDYFVTQGKIGKE